MLGGEASTGSSSRWRLTSAANCDADTLARYDQVFWKCALGRWEGAALCTARAIEGHLPTGDGSIVVAGNNYTLTIQWFDPADNIVKSFVFSATI